MEKLEYARLICAACTMGWLLVVLPCLLYLGTSWRTRRDRLFELFTAKAVSQYFEQFHRSLPPADRTLERFHKYFYERHGKWRYIIPIVVLALTASGIAFGVERT